jgi:hypothetical protein
MVDHTEGLEDFKEGLTGALQDDRFLRPPLMVRSFKLGDRPGMTAWLEREVLLAGTAEEDHLNLNFFFVGDRLYPDKTAVHFAAQEVANGYYGGETGNEVFFVFPSEVIASQYPFAFSTETKSFTSDEWVGNVWNDVLAWPPLKDQGIPIDAGLVFLPKDMPVDPKTGSRYDSELILVDGQEKRVVVKDAALIDRFVEWALLSDSAAIAAAFYAGQEPTADQAMLLAKAKDDLGTWFANDTADALIRFLAEKGRYGHVNERSARAIAKKERADWKQARNAIPAQVYWEQYFRERPDQQPKHIVYYNGDPTRAVSDFLGEHAIGRANATTDKGPLLGFDDNHVADMQTDPRAKTGYEEMITTARNIINDYYSPPVPEKVRWRDAVLNAIRKFLSSGPEQ